jgi:hypothetical protein
MPRRIHIDHLYNHYQQASQMRRIQAAVLLSVVVAGAVRLLYATWQVPDFWGDAYHHWLISRLTLESNGIYSDYKGMEAVWLPGYHYLVAAVMAIWGRFDLAPAHLTNTILGILACGLLAWLVTDVTRDWRVGLSAGLALALTPWHIAYSHINMPEVLAGALLLLALVAAWRGHAVWLAFLACAGTLTRHELTLMLALLGMWLAWRRRWRAALAIALGSSLGLVLWSAWSYYVTGDALHWWTHYQAAAAWDARFWTEARTRLDDLESLAQAAWQAYPPLWVGAVVVAGSLFIPGWRRRIPAPGWLLLALVALYWLILGLGFSAGHLPSADPRYLLVSLPALVGASVIFVAALPGRPMRFVGIGLYVVLLVTALPRQLSAFPTRAFVLAPERAAGEYLGSVAPVEGMFWVDAPVSIYHSGLGLARFASSDRLLPTETRTRASISQTALNAIRQNDIRFVLWEEVPYTLVQRVWPQMADGLAFDQDGYRLEPLFSYSGWELDYGAQPTMLWKIRPAPNGRWSILLGHQGSYCSNLQ